MAGKCVRGTVLDINLHPTVGREMMKTRPCLVIQNDIGNANSDLTVVAVITGAENRARILPIWVLVSKGEGGLAKDSIVLCNQIRTVDEMRFGKVYGRLTPATMQKVDKALAISLGLEITAESRF